MWLQHWCVSVQIRKQKILEKKNPWHTLCIEILKHFFKSTHTHKMAEHINYYINFQIMQNRNYKSGTQAWEIYVSNEAHFITQITTLNGHHIQATWRWMALHEIRLYKHTQFPERDLFLRLLDLQASCYSYQKKRIHICILITHLLSNPS